MPVAAAPTKAPGTIALTAADELRINVPTSATLNTWTLLIPATGSSNTWTAEIAVVQRLMAALMSGIMQCSYCDSVNVAGAGERPQAAMVSPLGKKPTRIVIPLAAAWLNMES